MLEETVALCARLFFAAGSHISAPEKPLDLLLLDDPRKAGVLACALELRSLLLGTEDGRKALRDLGFQPVFEEIEGE